MYIFLRACNIKSSHQTNSRTVSHNYPLRVALRSLTWSRVTRKAPGTQRTNEYVLLLVVEAVKQFGSTANYKQKTKTKPTVLWKQNGIENVKRTIRHLAEMRKRWEIASWMAVNGAIENGKGTQTPRRRQLGLLHRCYHIINNIIIW